MSLGNISSTLNTSTGDGEDLFSQDEVLNNGLEAYTVVLSLAAHILSMLFGGGSSVAIIVAITTRGNISRYSYTPVIIFCLACCCLNFIWSPLEVSDLVMFHYLHRHPCERFVAARTALYLFIILLISVIIVLVSVEGIIRLRNRFGRLLRKVWPLASCILALITSLFLTAIFITKCLQVEDNNSQSYYTITDRSLRFLILLLTVLAFSSVAIILIILVIIFVKETVYWEDGRPRLRQKKLKLEIPQFLISQSNACVDNDGGFGHSKSDTSSPTTPKFMIDGDPDASSIKGEDASHISELPATTVKPSGNRLGINMAQVLGRRRHTICQINDSTSVVTTPADHLARAKQYNYVRKFSVDISALQAQLQNPKIFRDAPYLSDMDLTRKQPSEASKSPVHKPLLPLTPLPGKFDEKEEKLDNTGAEPGSMPLNNPPPPVIMVSNDDAPPTTEEDETQNEMHGSNEAFHEEMTSSINSGTAAQKPTVLYFNESTEEHTSVPTLESAVSGPSDTESEGLKMTRLTLLMSLTFVLNMLPVLVTEILESRLRKHAFINIYTCTLAVSTIQTIVYPHLVASCDDVVHRAVAKLKRRMRNLFGCSNTDAQSPAEDSSSTGQF